MAVDPQTSKVSTKKQVSRSYGFGSAKEKLVGTQVLTVPMGTSVQISLPSSFIFHPRNCVAQCVVMCSASSIFPVPPPNSKLSQMNKAAGTGVIIFPTTQTMQEFSMEIPQNYHKFAFF